MALRASATTGYRLTECAMRATKHSVIHSAVLQAHRATSLEAAFHELMGPKTEDHNCAKDENGVDHQKK
jgi:hypothetical protein